MIKRPITFQMHDAVGGLLADLYDAEERNFATLRHMGDNPEAFKEEVRALVEFLNRKVSK